MEGSTPIWALHINILPFLDQSFNYCGVTCPGSRKPFAAPMRPLSEDTELPEGETFLGRHSLPWIRLLAHHVDDEWRTMRDQPAPSNQSAIHAEDTSSLSRGAVVPSDVHECTCTVAPKKLACHSKFVHTDRDDGTARRSLDI